MRMIIQITMRMNFMKMKLSYLHLGEGDQAQLVLKTGSKRFKMAAVRVKMAAVLVKMAAVLACQERVKDVEEVPCHQGKDDPVNLAIKQRKKGRKSGVNLRIWHLDWGPSWELL